MSLTTGFRSIGLCSAMLVLIALLGTQPEAPAREDAKGKKHALLIGVNVYEQSGNLPALKYAENDVTVLAAALKKHGGFDSVRILSNTAGKDSKADAPTVKNIRAELEALAKGKKDGDTVLVGFAGHGLQLEAADPDKKAKPKQFSYLCPHDADLTDKVRYSTGECASLVQVKEIFDALKLCGAGTKLVLMDACRNELEAENVSRAADLDVDSLRVPRGIGVMFGCSRGQKARETSKLGEGHGVFFHYVIEGLKGEAKDPKRGTVTWDRLVAYVKDEVSEYVEKEIGKGAEQKPAALGHQEGSTVLARFDLPKEKDGGTKVVKDKRPKTLTIKDKESGFEMEFVLIPATDKEGFFMGSTKEEQDAVIDDYENISKEKISDTLKDFYRAEGPRHRVELTKAFYLGKFEVTQGQWKALMGKDKNPSYFRKDGDGKDSVKDIKDEDLELFPVENVSWKDTQTFLDALGKLAKKQEIEMTFRLPTEAEWEYSCRGGPSVKEPFNFDGKPSKSISSSQANFDGNYPFGGADKGEFLNRTCKVGSYKPNTFGLYDMHGNVYEWCQDAYEAKAYKDEKRTDPSVSPKEDGSDRVYRGGGWYDNGQGCRSADRRRFVPVFRIGLLGFRVAAVPHK